MITANNLVPVGFSFEQSDFEIALMDAMARATRKYNTSVSLQPQEYSLAPFTISDATIVAGCNVTDACSVPSVITNTKIQMNEACKICLTDLTIGELTVYGIDQFDPQPTTELEGQKSRQQAMQLTYSGLKTYWLGDKTYEAGDLISDTLLPAYTKDYGQWYKIMSVNPAHVTIAENAGVSIAAQFAITYDEALIYIDQMIAAQSISMQMIMNSEKYIWSTVEIFDVIQSQRAKNELAGIRFVQIENEFGNFDAFVYRDITVIKYEHFSAAIKDKALNAGTYDLPNRMILTVGLPMMSFPKPVESTFQTDFRPVSKAWEAGTILTIMHPEAVDGDYYVIAY